MKVIEASGSIMGTFHRSLAEYTEKLFARRRIEVATGTSVREIRGNVAVLSSGEELPFGLMVWSTGVKPVQLTDAMGTGVLRAVDDDNIAPDAIFTVAKSPNGRVQVSDHMQVLHRVHGRGDGQDESETTLQPSEQALIFALGDCAANHAKPLPPLAQVAMQQGIYLANLLNSKHTELGDPRGAQFAVNAHAPFKYGHLGSMASIGDWKGVYDSSSIDEIKRLDQEIIPPTKGFAAFLLWRAAYWTRAVSISNKMLILMYWFKSAVFGRDISRF